MNAYELANELNRKLTGKLIGHTTAKLRQQADRIAELEKQCSEPVAWLWIHNGTTMNALLRNPAYDERSKEHWAKKGWTSKPLYTTPQIKELSDEEILQQAEWMFGTHFFEMIDDQYWIEFAKAILKKASER